MRVSDRRGGQRVRQRFAIEVRVASRPGKSSYVHQAPDVVLAQQIDELVQTSGPVPDRPDADGWLRADRRL